MKHLSTLFKLRDRLKMQARLLGLDYTCDVVLVGYDEAETRIENGQKYHYPEMIQVSIHSWNTWKLSYRLSNGRFVSEGRDLSGQGLSVGEVYRDVIRELKAHAKRIALSNEAHETNSIVYGDSLVVAENFDAREYFGLGEQVFRLYRDNGEFSQWYGYSAEDALNNAYPWVKDQKIVMISIESETKGA